MPSSTPKVCPDCKSETGKRGWIVVPPKSVGSVATFGREELCTNRWHDAEETEPVTPPEHSTTRGELGYCNIPALKPILAEAYDSRDSEVQGLQQKIAELEA